jgi:Na+/proline symporter
MDLEQTHHSNLDQETNNHAISTTLLYGWRNMMTAGAISSAIAVASQLDAVPVIGETIKNFDNRSPDMRLATMLSSPITLSLFPSALIVSSIVAGITIFNQYPKMLELEKVSTNENILFAEKEAKKKMQPMKAALSI